MKSETFVQKTSLAFRAIFMCLPFVVTISESAFAQRNLNALEQVVEEAAARGVFSDLTISLDGTTDRITDIASLKRIESRFRDIKTIFSSRTAATITQDRPGIFTCHPAAVNGVSVASFTVTSLDGLRACFPGNSTDSTILAGLATIDLQINAPTRQLENAIRWMHSLRSAGVSRDANAPVNVASIGKGGVALAGAYELADPPFSIFVNGGGTFGDTATTTESPGFKIFSQDTTVVLNYEHSDKVDAGLIVGYTGTQTDLASDLGTLDTTAYRVTPFVSLVPFENAYIHAMAGYSRYEYDSARGCKPCSRPARADYDANQFISSLSAGYTQNVGPWGFRGHAQGSFINTDISGYRETGADFPHVNLIFPSQNVISGTTLLGTEILYSLDTPYATITPDSTQTGCTNTRITAESSTSCRLTTISRSYRSRPLALSAIGATSAPASRWVYRVL
jgi:hypothetical protein